MGISHGAVLSVCLIVMISTLGGKSQSLPAAAAATLCRQDMCKLSIGMVV